MLDIMQLLVKYPQATYIIGVSGFALKDAGIDDGDLIVIDRASSRPVHPASHFRDQKCLNGTV